ncbi:hypothetical protein ACET3X_001389 [Alternaria dauci]|uniref:Uncharacterized protein n=1 Tax=Alternaria dauci TaxID=48095 RepID=A0ABR3UXH9_9PLEO
MGYYFSKTALLAVVLTSTLTSALVVPRGHRHMLPPLYAYWGSNQHHYPSRSQGTGYPHPTITDSSSAIGLGTPRTSCATSSTANITLPGSNIVPIASQTGSGYYPTSDDNTIYGYPTNRSTSLMMLSSTMVHTAESSVPPLETPVTSGYPIVSVVSSASNTPVPYPSNYATVSVAPYPTASLTLRGAQLSYNTYPAGTTPTAYIPISTGCTESSAYGTGYMPHSNVATSRIASGIYISNTLGSIHTQHASSSAKWTPPPISAGLSSNSAAPSATSTSAKPSSTCSDVVATPAQPTGGYIITPNGVAHMSA